MATARYHRTFLAIGVAAVVAYLAASIWMPALHISAHRALVLASITLLVLSVLAYSRGRPRAFDVRPRVPAFTAPTSAADIYTTLGLLGMVAIWTAASLDGQLIPLALVPILPAMATVLVVSSWRGTGIELRPDGLHHRDALGTLVVPWDALPVVPLLGPADRRTTLPVRYAHPELVRRRGIVSTRKPLSSSNIDPHLAAQLIRYYTTHPEHRRAIGTHAEYHRLLTENHESPPDQRDGDS